MADGDLGITFTIAGSGGASKSITIEKATYDLAKAYATALTEIGEADNVTDDASYLLFEINKVGRGIVNRANKRQNQAAIPTAKSFTAAT